MNNKRPNLNSYDVKNAEMFIAAEVVANYFKKANIASYITYEQKMLSYQAMNLPTRNKKTDELIDLIDDKFESESLEWGKYHSDIHFNNNSKEQSVIVDAGIFSLIITTDKKGEYNIEYMEL
ncbi:MAG: hypothetical protein K6E10_12300 [Eubacterium sp.]|nr:hypothetical protein [Eubacterium sp.]